jgi:NAD(P)H-hydrate repair Nnr-like enzyme with NAD(P)H-hydrate dehydratase domain
MTIALPETAAGSISPRGLREFKRLMEGKTAVAMGPGMGTHPETVEFIHAFVSNCSFPLVLDADALNAYAGQLGALRANGRAIVLTPHPGEMARLLGCRVEEIQANRVAVARRAAEEHDAMIVLKGHNTLVAEPSGRVWVNPTGNPGMAKGGTGDVLTGMLAGMLAQSAAAGARLWMEMPPSDGKRSQELEAKLRRAYEKKERYRLTASERKWLGPHFKKLQNRAAESEDLHRVLPVAAAVYLHGLAGDLARDEQDEATMLATDLLAALPRALRMTRWRAQEKFVHIR